MLSHFSHVQLFAALQTVAHQAPVSVGFSRQEYWSGLSCLPPGDLPDPGMEPSSPVCRQIFTAEPLGEVLKSNTCVLILLESNGLKRQKRK